MIIGIIGSLFLLFSWLWETIRTVEKHKRFIDLKFAFLHLIGSASLVFYAIEIGDIIFLILNTAILVFVLSEILVASFLIKKRKSPRKLSR